MHIVETLLSVHFLTLLLLALLLDDAKLALSGSSVHHTTIPYELYLLLPMNCAYGKKPS